MYFTGFLQEGKAEFVLRPSCTRLEGVQLVDWTRMPRICADLMVDFQRFFWSFQIINGLSLSLNEEYE